jgi:hypothetical protein
MIPVHKLFPYSMAIVYSNYILSWIVL